ncbi:MAG: addiction module protein [Sulfurovum sp.]|nr:addiction module protein [Sulfurovum sp.]
MSNTEIISEALNLPVAERLLIVNTLVKSFNPMDSEIEKKWLDEVTHRKNLLEEGKLDTISYSEFFGED